MFNRDPLEVIVSRTQEDLRSRLSQDELLRRADAPVLCRVLAGMAHEMYGYLDWTARQVLYDTSDEDVLARQASTWKVKQKPAEFASGNAVANGINGSVIEAGVILRRADGVEFVTDSEVVIAGGLAALTLTAVEAGAAGNSAAGTVLNLLNPIAGVQSQLVVDGAGLVNGSDKEEITPFRARFLRRLGAPSSGGALADYESWALEVPGVTRAWAVAGEMGSGTVTVRFVRDNDVSIIPDIAEAQAVHDYIMTRRPATARLYVVAPIADPQILKIQLTPGSISVKAAVEAELKDLWRRTARPTGTIFRSHIDEAISTASGEEDHVLIEPAANVLSAVGHMSTYGGVEWL